VQQIGTVTPLATGASNDVLFIPHHFQTALDTVIMPVDGFPALCGAQLACPDTGADPRFVYARQPFALTVTAQNLQNATTRNFDKQDASLNTQQVLLLARDAKDTVSAPPVSPAGSKLTDGSAAGTVLSGVPVSAFGNGVARQVLAYQFPGAYSPSAGAATLAAPTGVLLRANFTYSVNNLVTSNPSSQGKEAALTVVTGFISVPNSSGSELLPVRLDVQLKYWDGTAWRVNLADSISRFGKAQVVLANCLKQVVCSGLVVADQVYQFSTGVLAGNGRLTLQAPRVAGSVDVSVGGFSYLPSSVGRVVFGVFKSGPVLYLREMY
jgi:MSHA biogenesis protein MshQ